VSLQLVILVFEYGGEARKFLWEDKIYKNKKYILIINILN